MLIKNTKIVRKNSNLNNLLEFSKKDIETKIKLNFSDDVFGEICKHRKILVTEFNWQYLVIVLNMIVFNM